MPGDLPYLGSGSRGVQPERQSTGTPSGGRRGRSRTHRTVGGRTPREVVLPEPPGHRRVRLHYRLSSVNRTEALKTRIVFTVRLELLSDTRRPLTVRCVLGLKVYRTRVPKAVGPGLDPSGGSGVPLDLVEEVTSSPTARRLSTGKAPDRWP